VKKSQSQKCTKLTIDHFSSFTNEQSKSYIVAVFFPDYRGAAGVMG